VLDCLVDPERIDADLVSSVVIHHRTGFDMVPAPIEVAALDSVSLTALERLLWVLREQYEVIIIDTPSAWVPWTDMLLSNSDEVVMVTEMTVAGVRQARKQFDALRARELGIDDRISIVANRYDKAMLGGSSTGITMKESEKALSQPFAATIPNDTRDLQRAVNDGVTVPEIRKRSKFEKSVKALMTSILDKIKQAEQIG
jgi:pilus assembly protein CpaE